MAVAENAVARNGTSGQSYDSTVTVVSSDSNDLERSKPRNESVINTQKSKDDGNYQSGNDSHIELQESETINGAQMQKRFNMSEQHPQIVAKSGGGGFGANQHIQKGNSDDNENGLNDMSDLVEILSKLNPMAEEFVPPSLVNNHGGYLGNGFGFSNNFALQSNHGNTNGNSIKKKKNNFNQGRRRMNTRTSMAQREEVIRRTVYVSDIDQQVTEEQLAGLFVHCGQVVDCRICGDPNSVLRFAFIEFTDEEGARAALSLSGTVLGYYPLGVLPSKTAIAPVNPTFLPRSEDEREMCARTIYCTNIDKKVTQADVRLFFESFCGEVQRLRLLGDYHHSTRIAFVEFTAAESAILALNCSGAVLGSLPIRVSPSKTPVRPRIPRSPLMSHA